MYIADFWGLAAPYNQAVSAHVAVDVFRVCEVERGSELI
jgi:hypothetical protein